jgi:hypothetical protein
MIICFASLSGLRFSVISYLFVDALSNRDQPGSGGGMGGSTRRWEKYLQQICGLAV